MNVGAALDELSIGEFPYLENARAIQQGGITTRPGQTDYSTGLPSAVHSIRTLNNVATGKTVNIIGADKSLYVQPNMAGSPALPIDTAYSGDPLSLVRFRPDQSPEAWMYVSDQNKMRKVSVESSLKNVGIAPPLNPLDAEISSADYCVVSDFLTATGWVNSSGGSITQGTTSIPVSTTIQEILYDNGIDGFGCVVPSSTDNAWALAGSRMILTGANTNIVTIEEVHNPISASTIVGIQYDEGSSGLCCIVLGTVTTGLDRNSIVLITSEYVRVLSVSVGPDGLYSFRCSTASSHAVGESVVGQTSLRIYTPTPNSNGDAITQVGLFFDCTAPTISGEILTVEVDTGGSGYSVSDLLFITQAGAFGGSVTVTSVSGGAVTGVTLTAGGSGYFPAYGLPVIGGHGSGAGITILTVTNPNFFNTTTASLLIDLDLSQVNGRPIQPDDYMHITLIPSDPTLIFSAAVYLDVDATTHDFTDNYYFKEFTQADLIPTVTENLLNPTVSLNQQVSLFFPISELQRVGSDLTRTLANVAQIGISVNATADVSMGALSWWAGSTYGPVCVPGAPIGISYRYCYRDSTTGVSSIPGPATRYDVFPLRQRVTLTIPASPDPACNFIDVERLDPNLQGGGATGPQWHYVLSVPNPNINLQPAAFGLDVYTPEYLQNTPALDITAIQPVPSLQPPLTIYGAFVTGTSLLMRTPLPFNNLLQGTEILINDVVYQLYQTPAPGSLLLQLVQSAGYQADVNALIGSPVLYGQPMPYMFGPLEGPTASFVFWLGDPNNPGYLYWCNGNNPDACNSSNFIEVTSPSEPLISGCVWNSYVFVASRDRVFLVQPTFDQPNLFTPVSIRTNSGVQGRWLMCAGADGVYFGGRDGIYKATPYAGADMVSRELWPLFTHEGQGGSDPSAEGM